jgi:hypothetical protein
MSSRNLSPVSTRELAARCRDEARRPGVPTQTAILLFLTSHRLEASADRHLHQAAVLERSEAKRA